MGTLKSMLVAWMAMALVALPAAAGDYWSGSRDEPQHKKVRTVQYNSAGQKITVWRDLGKTSQVEEGDSNNPFEGPDIGSEELPSGAQPGGSYAPHGGHYGPIEPDCGAAMDDCWDDSCCDNRCAPCPIWAHRTHVFGEYLYLQAANVDMPHAVQIGDVGGPGPVALGPVAVASPPFTPAYRVGFALALSDCGSVGVSYANFHSHSLASDEAEPDTALRSLVLAPNSVNGDSVGTFLQSDYVVDFQTVDVVYRGLLHGGCRGAINFVGGARYGKLFQSFSQIQSFTGETADTLVGTDISFEGGGLRLGLDGERVLGGSRLSLYCQGFANLLFGQFHSNYVQLDNTTASFVQGLSNWTDNRIVPVLEVQAGINWTSCNGRWRSSAGYYAAFWTNAVTTQEFVQAVQSSNFANLGQTVAFDGLVSRLEFRF